jgi:hypothetical protein
MRKYISEIQDNNFVYPNNDPYQYGVEIVHDINNKSVSGTVTNFVAVKSGANIVITFNYSWSKNGAEPFISQSNRLSLLSVHMMTPDKTYYKPWRMVDYVYETNINTTLKNGSVSMTVTPSQMGQASFTDGLYYFEIRMIGHRAIFPICVQGTISTVTPTPTPTKTQAGPAITSTPTLTPTPSRSAGSVIPTPTPTLTPTKSQTLSYYPITLRLVGSDGRNGSLSVWQSSDGIDFTESAVITVTGNNTTNQGFNGTPGYYYYFIVRKTFGPLATINAYVDAIPDLSPSIDGAWCDTSASILTTDTFQLPNPVQSTTSNLWFGSVTSSGCL